MRELDAADLEFAPRPPPFLRGAAPDSQPPRPSGGADSSPPAAPSVAPAARRTAPAGPPSQPAPGAAAMPAVQAARTALDGGDLSAAAAALKTAAGAADYRPVAHYAPLAAAAREFFWHASRPAPAAVRRDLAVQAVLEVCRQIDFRAPVATAERLLVQSIPEDERRARIEALLVSSPQSIPILQAASRLAADGGDDDAWIRHLTAAGREFLAVGDLTLASRMFMALRAHAPGSPAAAEGMAGVFRLGQELVEANTRWEQIEVALTAADSAREALELCVPFREAYPHHEPALRRTAALHEAAGDNTEAARLYLDLATRAIYREEEGDAREALRAVLRTDHGNEEALMALAILVPPELDAPKVIWQLKVALLEREGLIDAALFHARAHLAGAPRDFKALARVAALCRAGGRDPSPHLIAQGHIAWEAGDTALARDCFEAAMDEAPDRDEVVAQLLAHEGIQELIPPEVLLKLP